MVKNVVFLYAFTRSHYDMKSLLLTLLCVFTISASAQTITRADFLSRVGIEYTSTSYNGDTDTPNFEAIVDALIAKSGTGQTWDMSTITYVAAGQSTTTVQAGTSGAVGAEDPKLAVSNYVSRGHTATEPYMTIWSFITLTDDAEYINGITSDSLGVPQFKLVYDPPIKSLVFPLSVGSAWVESMDSVEIDYGGGITAVITTTTNTTVDGSGTLNVPGGLSATALRITADVHTTTTIAGQTVLETTSTSYMFMAVNGNLSANLQPAAPSPIPGGPSTPAYAFYSVSGVGGSVAGEALDAQQFSYSANPTTGLTTVGFVLGSAAKLQLSVLDALGREVHAVNSIYHEAGPVTVALDLSHLPVGTYVLHGRAGAENFIGKIIVNR